jgi:hypothetical protein
MVMLLPGFMEMIVVAMLLAGQVYVFFVRVIGTVDGRRLRFRGLLHQWARVHKPEADSQGNDEPGKKSCSSHYSLKA